MVGYEAFSGRYAEARRQCGGSCPIEAGQLGRLADNECKHGRLAGDPTAPCGCWPTESAVVIELPVRPAIAA